MNYSIREAIEKDFASILKLIKELAEFEKAPGKVTNSVEQMKLEKDYFHCFVAETSTGIVGMALYYFAYSTWVGKTLYLEDIIVSEAFRGNNIGTALMRKIFEEAKTKDCKRIRWQVLKWNKAAIEMYTKFGADIDGEWLNCTVDQNSI